MTPPPPRSLASYVENFANLLARIDPREVEALADALVDAYRHDRFVFVVGNGGSGANASHLCEDLGKGTLSDFERQKRLKIMSLTDNTPYILAWGNDVGYDRVFVEQLKNFASPGAILIAISGSGSSPNVLRAVEYANEIGMITFGVTGYDGGKLRALARHAVHVPSDNMGAVESAHLVIFHYILDTLYHRFRAAEGAALASPGAPPAAPHRPPAVA
jgi:D-sedoheptulose 7-phosphate isomerase